MSIRPPHQEYSSCLGGSPLSTPVEAAFFYAPKRCAGGTQVHLATQRRPHAPSRSHFPAGLSHASLKPLQGWLLRLAVSLSAQRHLPITVSGRGQAHIEKSLSEYCALYELDSLAGECRRSRSKTGPISARRSEHRRHKSHILTLFFESICMLRT